MKKIKGLTFFKIAFYTPLYEKGIKQNQNKPMETTIFENVFFLP